MNGYKSVNDTPNYYGEDEYDNGPSLPTRIAFASTWIIIAVAGVLGNSLVIFIAIRFQKMTNVTNCFIVNCNGYNGYCLFGILYAILVVQYTLDQWFFDQIFCKLLNFMCFVSVLVTVLTLVAMTMDRYIYVVRPFENLKWRKPRTVLLLSIIIWLASCIFASPYYYHYGVTNIHDNYRQCVLLSEENIQKQFRIYTVTLYYFIPLTIIIITYTKLLYFLYAKETKYQSQTKHNIIRRSKKRRAVTKMIAIVTLVFALCWLPITLFIMSANVFERRTAFLYYFKVLGNSFAYLNSAINPILYAFLNRSFRNNCGSLLSKRSCSFFCQNHINNDEMNRRHIDQQNHMQKRLPSTQIDRFSYQSTNCQSPSSTQDKKKKQILIAINSNPLSTDITSRNDYSDVDYDRTDVDIPMKKYMTVATDETKSSNTMTTNL